MAYNSAYKGSQVDAAVGAVLAKEGIWDAASGAAKSYWHAFEASDWSSDGTLVIPAETHGITGSRVLCQALQRSGEAYIRGTWATMETYAAIDGASHDITLHSTARYAGGVLLMG